MPDGAMDSLAGHVCKSFAEGWKLAGMGGHRMLVWESWNFNQYILLLLKFWLARASDPLLCRTYSSCFRRCKDGYRCCDTSTPNVDGPHQWGCFCSESAVDWLEPLVDIYLETIFAADGLTLLHLRYL